CVAQAVRLRGVRGICSQLRGVLGVVANAFCSGKKLIFLRAAQFAAAWSADDRGVAGENQSEEPISRHLHLLFQSYQLIQVNCVPEEPGEVAAKLDSCDCDHGVVRSEGNEHALRRVLVRLERFAAPQVPYVPGGYASLFYGDRSDARRFWRIYSR